MKKIKIISLLITIFILISVIFGIKAYSSTAACDMILTYEGNNKLISGQQKEISIIASNIQFENGIILYNGVLEYDNDKIDVQIKNSDGWEMYHQKDNNITLVSKDLENKKADQIIGKILITAKEEIELNGDMIKLVKGEVTDGEDVGGTLDSSLINIEYSTKELTNKNVIVKITSDTELEEKEGWSITNDKKVLQKEYEKNIQESVTVKLITGGIVTFNINIDNIDKVFPKIEGVEEGKKYINSVNLQITDENLTTTELVKDGNIIQGYKQGEIIGEGKYTIKALDKAGNETIVNFEIIDDTLINLKIEKLPEKLIYCKGDTLDTKGLVVVGEYYSGATAQITEYTCSPTVLNEIGKQNITIACEDFETTFEVEVEEIKLIGIEVKESPRRTKYETGQTLNTKGLIILEKYNNGTEIEITEGFECSPTKLNTEGKQEIVVEYKNFKATFDVNVETICDVILFWGQSNMRATIGSNENERGIDTRIPTTEKELATISAQTGIKSEYLYRATSTNDLTNINRINYTKIFPVVNEDKLKKETAGENSMFEYLYLGSDNNPNGSLRDLYLNSQSHRYGEYLYLDSNNQLVEWTGTETVENTLQKSYGTNMVPAFCAQYYAKTGRKVVAVICAKGNRKIADYEPGTDIYKAMTIKYNAAIECLKNEGYTIGNRLYVAFQGESDAANGTSKDAYKTSFRTIADALKKTSEEGGCQITKGAIVETSRQLGYNKLENVNAIHEAQVELIWDYADIIKGSEFPYNNYIPDEETYNSAGYSNSKYVDENGKKLEYAEALKIASYSTSNNANNTVHFTSAALSQIGYETANSYATYSLIRVNKANSKLNYRIGEKLDYKKIMIERKTVSNIYDDITEECTFSIKDGTKLDTLGEQTIKATYHYVDEDLGKDKELTVEFKINVEEAQLDTISIEKIPSKTEYIEGEKFDKTGMVVIANYNNGESKVIENYAINPIEELTVNDTKVIITYSEDNITKTVEQPITVRNKLIESILPYTLPDKSTYIEGDTLETDGLSIQVIYDNKTEEIISEGFVCTPEKLDIPGEQIITVKYGDKITSFVVDVEENTLEKIEVATAPTKTTYIAGDKLATSGLKIKATYKNGTTKEIDNSELTCSPTSLTTVGTQIITVTYEGKTATFEVTVEENTLEKIEVATAPIKTTYIAGDTLEIEGLKVIATSKNGETIEIDNSKLEFSPTSLTAVGTQIITVTYEGKTTTFEVTVEENTLEKIEVATSPTKTTYIDGDTLEIEGLKVIATSKNGETREIDNSKLEFSPTSLTTVGTQIITVTYEGKTATFEVTVEENTLEKIEVATSPTKTTYIAGDILEIEGLKVIAIYKNGTTREIDNTELTFSPTSLTKEGTQTIIVTYEEKTATFEVKVEDAELESIYVREKPNKTEYIEGEYFDDTGMSVFATYNNGDYIEIENYTVSPKEKLTLNDTKIIITYTEGGITKITEQSITVIPKKVETIQINTLPTKNTYFVGEKLETEGLTVKAIYNDKTEEIISNGFICNPSELNTVGTQTITVEYEGKIAEFEVLVQAVELISVEIKQAPDKIEYIEGQYFDKTGMIIIAKYNNGDVREISDYTIIPTEKLTLEDNKVIISYIEGGILAKVEQPIIVKAKKVENIAINTLPIKLVYFEGQDLETKGLTIKVGYDNKEEDVITEGFECTPMQLDTVGTQTITVEYAGKTATYEVTVLGLQLTGIKIKNYPIKLNYELGDMLNTEGLEIIAIYNNVLEKVITEGFECTPKILDKLGKQEIIVSYEGFTTTFEVNVRKIESIRIKTNPRETIYFVGEVLDSRGVELIVKYTDGTEEVVTKGYKFEPQILDTVGQQEIIVKYKEFTTSFEVKVIDVTLADLIIKSNPTKTVYYEGETLDTQGLEVVVRFNDGTEKVVEEYTCNPTKLTQVGKQEVIISYKGISTRFEIEVKAIELVNIKIKTAPNKTEYIEGEYFDNNGMTVEVEYNNGDIKEVTNYIVETTNQLKPSDTEVTISYVENKIKVITKQPIKVIEKAVESIEIVTLPNKTTYYEGEMLNLEGIKVIAKYNNKDIIDITDYFLNQQIILTEIGNQEIALSYEGKIAVFTVVVKEKLKVIIKEYKEVIAETENYITKVNPDAKIENLLNNIETNKNAIIKIFKGENEITNKEEKLATGMRVEISLEEQRVIYTIIVDGDANGDGNVDIQDMIVINNYRLFGTTTNFGWIYQQAADVNKDGNIDIQDMIKINTYRLFGTKF